MKKLCFLFLLPISIAATAQEEETIREAIAHIAENTTEDIDFSELSERLAGFRNRPIDLNKTSQEELKSLFILSPIQIGNFFSYRSTHKLLNILELQSIPSFDLTTINRILPFITLTNPRHYEKVNTGSILNEGNHDIIFRYARLLEKQKGFKDLGGSKYLGSAEKLLLKYKYNFQKLVTAALVIEKDAGEQLFNSKGMPDYVSAHIALFKLGRVQKWVVGDYSMQFGQGLTLWSGFSFGKSTDVTSVAAKDIGLKPYTSANESTFFRGTASSILLGQHIHLTPFISFRNLDASLKTESDGSVTLSNIIVSGLHRTATERKNQNSVEQKVYGGVLQYISDNLNFGIITYQSHYQHRFTTGAQAYNKYGFTGKTLNNLGTHYNYTFKNIYLYGEIAHSIGSGYAMINGAMASLSPSTSVVVLHRNYDRNYHNFFSQAIGEGTESNNEKGWYGGVNYNLGKNLIWSVYADYFKFPWLKYRVNSPSQGYEILSRLTYIRGKHFKATLRFKAERKQQNPDAGSTQKTLEDVVKENYRVEWSRKINQKFNFHQRTEVTTYQKGINTKEIGYMLYQDIDFNPTPSRISMNMRFALFKTPSYNSRIHAYEDDVLYGSGSGVYSEKGIRTFINTRYRLYKHLDIWTRFAIFLYKKATSIGTGLDQIEGNKKSEVKFQLRYQF